MTYTSLEFFLLFVLTFGAYTLLSGRKARCCIILSSSLLFYLWSGFFDFAVFLFVVAISYLAVLCAHRFPRWRRPAIFFGVLVLAVHLFAWKYLAWFATLFGGQLTLPLPIGISFFTLQGIAYLVDYLRGEAEFMSFAEFLTFKSFFAQLVAGPIVRAKEILPYLQRFETAEDWQVLEGGFLAALGLFKKLVIADYLALLANTVFSNPTHFDRTTLMFAAVAFYMQIWADFSGYTDIGRGCALMLGVRLPQNFYSAMWAQGPGDWMNRWHVTLVRWMSSYVYTPFKNALNSFLARFGFQNRWRVVKHLFTLGLVLIAVGLWHGARANFFFYGIALCFLNFSEFFFRRIGNPIRLLPSALRAPAAWLTFFPFAVATGVIFRCTDATKIVDYFSSLLLTQPQSVSLFEFIRPMLSYMLLVFAIDAVFYFDLKTRSFPLLLRMQELSRPAWEDYPRLSKAFACAVTLALLVSAIHFRVASTLQGFIYFQF